MKTLVVAVAALAVVLLILGLALEALAFLLGVAPVLAFVALLLLILSRRRGRRIPQ